MSNATERLGRSVAWQIRDILKAIRDAVVEQARVEKVNVPELVTRLVLDARAHGWSFAASTLYANLSNTANQARVRAVFEMAADMGRAGVPVQKGVSALLNRLVKRKLNDVLDVPPKSGLTLEEPHAVIEGG